MLKVSIITVCYNSESTIIHNIKSVNNQNYENIEHIFVDGKSSDETVKIIQENCSVHHQIISERDEGIYDAMNKGIALASGDIIGFLNSDDVFFDNSVISRISSEFQKNQKIDIVYGNLIYFNERNITTRVWLSKPYKKGLFAYSWTPAHPTFYCKLEVYERYGNYRTDFKIASDVDLMFRLLEIKKLNSHYIPSFLIKMKEGGISNRGFSSTLTIIKEVRRTHKENQLNFNIAKYLFGKLYKAIIQKTW